MHYCDSVLRCKKKKHIYQLVILISVHVFALSNNDVFYGMKWRHEPHELNLDFQQTAQHFKTKVLTLLAAYI